MPSKLNAQQVEDILDSPLSALTRVNKVNKEKREGKSLFSSEAKVMALGREYDRGSIETMRHVYENLKAKKVGCQLLQEFSKDRYVIIEEYIR